MKKQDFKNITITELTKRTGVGRVSFYRNFESKEDILVKKLDELAMIWHEELEKEENPDVIIGLFSHFLKHKELIQLLYNSNLSNLLMKNVYNCCGPKPDQDNVTAYFNASLAGGVFAWCDEWVKRGMQETQQEMAEFWASAQGVSNKS